MTIKSQVVSIRHVGVALLGGLLVLAGAGCDGRSPGHAGVSGGDASSRFALAHGCFHLRANDFYVVRNGDGFVAVGPDAVGAQRFYMQPANLGRYLFYTDDLHLMTANGMAVTAVDSTVDDFSPTDGADWTLAGDTDQFTAQALAQPLAVAENGTLVLGTQAATLAFEPADGCVPYPEMPTGIAADTFKANPVGEPVVGFAEIHAHMGMGSEMSDGSRDVGPSAGGVMYGQTINRFGAPEALKNCVDMHGENGRLSAENALLDGDPAATHETQGWPTFTDWPFHDSFLHQQMYWKWVERAWKAGLRVMVVHGTGIEALCNLGQATYGDPNADCRDMGNGEDQVRYMFDVQDYVDAQYGGPGQGWFRVVFDPQQAREVIAEGKLAVMLGYEFPNIWFCRVQFPNTPAEMRECDEASIDAEIERAWNLGIRNVFPYHDVDSSLGGTGIFSSVLNYVGFSDTKSFWDTYDCPDGGTGETYFYDAGAVLEASVPEPLNPVIDGINDNLPSPIPLPVANSNRQCNRRTVTDLGAYAINKMMKRGFVIHIDHAELISKGYILDQGALTVPNYPNPSGHGAQGGLTVAQAEQLIAQGGIIYPALPNGAGWVDFRDRLKPLWDANTTRPFAVGYGADANGLRTLPGPRGMGSDPVEYPFTLFSGPDWSSSLFSGFAPMQVDMLSIPLPDGRAWDVNQDGMYHFGMVPDIIEEIRIEGGGEALDAFYRSAEAYLQLWEQTLAASMDAQDLPIPDTLPMAPE